jgi:hypothetical protein
MQKMASNKGRKYPVSLPFSVSLNAESVSKASQRCDLGVSKRSNSAGQHKWNQSTGMPSFGPAPNQERSTVGVDTRNSTAHRRDSAGVNRARGVHN